MDDVCYIYSAHLCVNVAPVMEHDVVITLCNIYICISCYIYSAHLCVNVAPVMGHDVVITLCNIYIHLLVLYLFSPLMC